MTVDSLSSTIHLLGDTLGQVIAEIESPAVFELVERIRHLGKQRRSGGEAAASDLAAEVHSLSPELSRALASAFTLYFDLVNLAEEDHRIAVLRGREAEQYPDPIPESIANAVASLSASGFAAKQMASLLETLQIELVLTAHPTEAKRRSILSKLQRIAGHIRDLNTPGRLPREQAATRDDILAEVTSIWLTDRARTVRPTPDDEVRTGLFFVDEVLWDVLPRIYDSLDRALAQYYPGLAIDHPWLTLATWMGGDRDGNPYVTAGITAETLRLHRGLAVERFRHEFQELARRLSLSSRRIPPPADLKTWLEARHPLPPHVAFLEKRYPQEPYRLAVALLADDLAEASQVDMTAHLLSDEPGGARVRSDDLRFVLDTVGENLPPILVRERLHTVRRQLDIFGLHAMRLDLRQDAGQLVTALAELLRGLDLVTGFERAPLSTRKEVVVHLLSQPAPALASRAGVTGETAETWALFKLVARARALYGQNMFGPFIISMVRDETDVLTALLLARWAGCDRGLQIVPLFETRAALQDAGHVLEALFRLDTYREHLATCQDEQMVMIGYSDSNKDGGYLSANWALYEAQRDIATVCRENGIEYVLFHGRGGTEARGGGPASRAIRAQPLDTMNGRFRLTEQGEIIAARYSNRELTHRHLGQIVSAVLKSSAEGLSAQREPEEWRSAMATLAAAAWDAYRAMVYERPGFVEFWRAATPIDEVMRLHIGSRPATRGSKPLDVSTVRAIPWVFSWMQSRFNLPGWYGLGAGLSAGVPQDLLREMYRSWPFFQAVVDNAEMAMMKADMGIAALYLDLVPDRQLAQSMYHDIVNEFERTSSALLSVSGHEQLLAADPVIQRSVHLRNPYIDPLNYLQVETLARLRSLADPDGAEAEALRDVMVLTINGIAAGLRNTG